MKRVMILGLVLGAVAMTGCSTSSKGTYTSSEDDGIFYCKLGQFDVFMLVEGQREGNAGILVGVDEALLEQYIPESGFMHTANAFLIKAAGKNYMVDMGTGADGVLLGKLKKLGVEPDQVSAVFLTHLHGDHFGGLVKDGEAALPGAKVYLSAVEHEYFTQTQANDGAVAALAPYEVETFEPGELGATLEQLVPGISPIANYGHTPGHTVYLVESGKEQLIIAGDYLHVGLVQFARPDISASYDMDKEEAAASRVQILGYAAQNKLPIGGMHVVYPGIGFVEADGEGFIFSPAK